MKLPVRIFSTKRLQPAMGEAFRAMGWEFFEDDLIQIRNLPLPENLNLPAVAPWIFTSQHGVKSAEALIRTMDVNQTIYCLEGATRAALLEINPFAQIAAVAPDGARLAEIIVQQERGPAMFFCGNLHRPELPKILSEAGIDLLEIVVYETKLNPIVVSSGIDALLFFSPSAVQSFFQSNRITASTACFAIGDTTAASILQFAPAQQVLIAAKPTQEAVFDLLKQYFQSFSFESA